MEKKVLIIEDDLIDQMAIKRLFKKKTIPYPYTLVSSIKDAKRELSEQEFHLVISDHNLADGTTFDLLDDLKNIPLILITGNQETATVASVLENSNAIASFTKDLDFKYLEELPNLIQQNLDQIDLTKTPRNNIFTKSKSLTLKQDNVTIDLSIIFKIFDEKKDDIKETIELFIYNKPREMNDLYQSLHLKNCDTVVKISHRMKSGFRILGMKNQEQLATFIEKAVGDSIEKCSCPKVGNAFKQLSTDTKIAIELLQKELPLL